MISLLLEGRRGRLSPAITVSSSKAVDIKGLFHEKNLSVVYGHLVSGLPVRVGRRRKTGPAPHRDSRHGRDHYRRGAFRNGNQGLSGGGREYRPSSHLGADAAVRSGARGIVHAGMGNGGMSAVMKAALRDAAAKGVVIVRSSRTGGGLVTPQGAYDRMGFLVSGYLNPQKARILLMLALTGTGDLKNIQRIFDKY